MPSSKRPPIMRREVMSVKPCALCLVAYAMLAACCGAAADVTPVGVERKTLVATAVDAPPVIDGDLSEAVWRLAEPSGGFVVEDSGRRASQPTELRALSDADNLYLGVVCKEPKPELMRAKVTEDNDDIWGDDLIEFNFDPTGMNKAIYQIRVNTLGTKELRVPGVKETKVSALRAAAKIGEDEWRFELAVPFASLGISRRPEVQMRWRINFERLRTVGGDEDDDWQYTAGDWANPEVYGHLVIPGTQVELTEVGAFAKPTPLPGNETHFLLTDLSASAHDYLVTLFDVTAGKQRLAQGSAAVPGGRKCRADLSFALTGAAGTRTLLWQVCEAATGNVLYTYERSFEVSDIMRVRIQAPRYRGYLFPDLKQVRLKVSLEATDEALSQMTLQVRLFEEGTDAVRAARDIKSPLAVNLVELPAKVIGDKPCRLEVAARETATGRVVSSDSFLLRRLSAAQVRALKYYVDEYGRMVHEGKPFLPIGFYLSGAEQIREIAQGGYNAALNYGMYTWKDEQLQAYLDAAQQHGVGAIFDVNGLYPSQDGTEEQWDKAYERARALIAKWKDHPGMMAWYLNDERPAEMVPHLRKFYEVFRDNDSDHPCFIVHFVTKIFPLYAHTCDIFSSDPYPIPTGSVTYAASQTQAAADAMDGQGAVWTVPQAFAWYQMWEPEDPSLGTGRDRIPTASELKRGRAPTYEETRCMTWLSLVHGAKGLIYWAYYNMRQLPQYQEMWAWFQDIGREVRSLEQVILSPDDAPVPIFSPRPAAIHCMAKVYEGKTYLFVVNGERRPWLGRAELPAGLTRTSATDLFSGETIVARGDSLPLRLPALGVRALRFNDGGE